AEAGARFCPARERLPREPPRPRAATGVRGARRSRAGVGRAARGAREQRTGPRDHLIDANDSRASSIGPAGRTPIASVAATATRMLATRHGRAPGATIARPPSVMYIATSTPR